MLLRCTRGNNYNGRFYVMCILTKLEKRNQMRDHELLIPAQEVEEVEREKKRKTYFLDQHCLTELSVMVNKVTCVICCSRS